MHLEHFNRLINDQRLATLFYVAGLGGSRDPAPKPEVLRGTAEGIARFYNEVRSMKHSLFGRPLVKRNPAVTNRDCVPGGSRDDIIPYPQPTRFELFISMKTAKTLSIELRNSILVRADKVIE